MPRQKAERDTALALNPEQVDSVNDLTRRDDKVDNLEVGLQPVPDKNSTSIDKLAQLQVRRCARCESNQMKWAHGRVGRW